VPECAVCNENAGGVASSGLGPVSFPYCASCMVNNAEPESMFEFVYEQCGQMVAGHVKKTFTFKDGEYISWKEWVRAKVKSEDKK